MRNENMNAMTDLLRQQLAEKDELPESIQLTPCPECHSSPTISYKARTGRYIAVHRVPCSRETIGDPDVNQVREQWEAQAAATAEQIMELALKGTINGRPVK